jgi:MOSC domain-containing protein YiiM
MNETAYLSIEELEAGLGSILQSPRDAGTLKYIVRRPRVDEREILSEATLDLQEGLVGDTWVSRGEGPHDLNRQLTLMNARVIALVAGTKDRWVLAGDQLFVDLDLSTANLPPGSQLAVGTAIIEITALPHSGCDKFKARFGRDALVFVNGPAHRDLRLRGVNARILQPGKVRTGDLIRKI